MGLFSKPKQQSVTLPGTPDWMTKAGKATSQLISKYLPQYQPGQNYPGAFPSAEPQGYELQGLGSLQQYLDQPDIGENLAMGNRELQRTFSDFYDPRTSDFYKSFRTGAERDLQDQIEAQRRGDSARGRYFTEGAQRDESRSRDSVTNYLNQILGGLYETERGRRFQALPYALQYEQATTQAPLRKTAASQQYGNLPRMLQEADFERRYADFQRKQQEYQGLIGPGAGMAASYQAPMTLYGQGGGSSAFSDIMKIAGPALSAGMMMFPPTAPIGAAGKAGSLSGMTLPGMVPNIFA